MMGRTQRNLVRTALAIGASLGAISASGVAQAQAARGEKAAPQGASTDNVAEIVVTAQFRAQKLQDTPLAITAVNAALMEARSQTNLAQVADTAPNVTLKPQGASFGPSVSASIRGIGQSIEDVKTFGVERREKRMERELTDDEKKKFTASVDEIIDYLDANPQTLGAGKAGHMSHSLKRFKNAQQTMNSAMHNPFQPIDRLVAIGLRTELVPLLRHLIESD